MQGNVDVASQRDHIRRSAITLLTPYIKEKAKSEKQNKGTITRHEEKRKAKRHVSAATYAQSVSNHSTDILINNNGMSLFMKNN
jgi:siroheme synthase (precorrin-2 oxidase/ferrochelatase)